MTAMYEYGDIWVTEYGQVRYTLKNRMGVYEYSPDSYSVYTLSLRMYYPEVMKVRDRIIHGQDMK
jgi:hypothetical protein